MTMISLSFRILLVPGANNFIFLRSIFKIKGLSIIFTVYYLSPRANLDFIFYALGDPVELVGLSATDVIGYLTDKPLLVPSFEGAVTLCRCLTLKVHARPKDRLLIVSFL